MTAPNKPKSKALTFNASGDNTLIAAPGAGLAIVVWKIWFTTAAAVNVTFYNGASPTTPLSGAAVFPAAGSLALDGPEGFELYRMAANTAFVVNLSGAVALGGTVWYTVE